MSNTILNPGVIPNTADAVADLFENAATTNPSDLARIQASVSGAGVVYNSQGAGAANRTLLQSALNTGGVSTAGRGGDVIYIDQHLSVPAESHLFIDGPTLGIIDGVNDYVVGSAAMDRPWQPVTVTWTSGRQATVTGLAGLSYGDAITLQGDAATATDWYDVFRVGTVAGASATIFLHATPTSAPAGAIVAKLMDNGIRVRAKIRHSGAAGGQSVARMGAVFAFVSNADIRINNSDNTPKYGLLTAATLDSAFTCISDRETNSDTLKLYGPSRGCRAWAAGGSSHEDCCSVQPVEPPAFIAYQPAVGSVSDLEVSVRGSTGTGSGPLVIYTDDKYGTGVAVTGGVLTSTDIAPALAIKLGDTQVAPASRVSKGVTLRGVNLVAGKGSCVEITGYKAKALTFDGCEMTAPGGATYRTCRVGSTSSIGTLTFRSVNFNFGAWPATTDQAIVIDGAVDMLVFDGCAISASTALRFLSCNSGSTVKSIVFRNCSVSSAIDQLVEVQVGAYAPRISVESGSYIVTALVKAKVSSCVVSVHAGAEVSGAVNGVMRYDTAATVGTYADYGARLTIGSVPIGLANGAEAIINAPLTSINITTAGIRRQSGSECISSSAAGTIPAGQPVIADGTMWRSRVNAALTYP